MKYDFETLVDRSNTGSSKWEQMKKLNPDVEGIVPYSVADMELKNPPEIIEGLKKYLDEIILGYAVPTKGFYNAVSGWMKKRHNWEIKPEWIVNSSGVVSAFYTAVRAYTNPGDGVIINSPVYYPFYMAIEQNGRNVVKNPLINDGNTYVIDYEDLEQKAKDPKNKILLFCSPHNPVGRVWKKEELEKVADICLRNNVLIVSDEIHNDLIMPGYQHTVFAAISEEAANNMIICTAPSKTFNLAGVQASNIIIPNEALREAFQKELASIGFHQLNIFGYKACEIAYTECEEWLEQLIEHIHHNHVELKKYLAEHLPDVKVYDLEGTYLQWMDFNAYGMANDELEKFMHNEAKVFLDEGYIFGEEADGFERMNIACPTKTMMEGLERLVKAVKKLQAVK
ncbi:MalY/PatB family protein [Neobacillus mesonae]|uniref:MalY/PatB family protein n=1 Tax=Neobacillus mesonae TaxID=1193713 RepID=UPI0020400F8E|nr:MalY/PatB family protein [Neobacillus mesonae]MCM3570954.1 pyridoxal phosphate-dependent aminotransferase [Neobacillus mesonae]